MKDTLSKVISRGASARKLAAAFWFVPFLLLTRPAWAAERQVLYGHVPAAVTGLQPVARLLRSSRLDLAIGLPLRNREALTNLLDGLYDPASTNFHHYLTPDRFAEMFGPTKKDYQSLIDFARSNGLAVTSIHSNRTLLDVNGSVGDIEKALHIAMQLYQHPNEARTFYAPDAEPSLDLVVPALDISGLDNYIVPRPRKVRASFPNRAVKGVPRIGSGPSGTFMGNDFRAAYAPGVTLLTGAGQVVGLFELDGYYPSDIAAYENRAGLPDVPLRNVLLDNFDGTPGSGNDEVSADIDMAIAMAPGLSQVTVYEGRLPNSVLHEIAHPSQGEPLPAQVSDSWGYAINSSTVEAYQEIAAQGQSYFSASGDAGAYTGAIDPPEDVPYITIVGGTSLKTTGPGGSWVSETTWAGSGGGISTTFQIPGWQQGIDMSANQGSTAMRNLPDVAMVADNIWTVANNGMDCYAPGTSLAAPLWAGFIALANQEAASKGRPPVGFINPAIYLIGKYHPADYAAAFHDITSGNNAHTGSGGKFSAVTGYDLCTGWGTPSGAYLINYLAGSLTVWVNFGASDPGNGTLDRPYNTLAAAVDGVAAGGEIIIEGPGSSGEPMPVPISKSMKIFSVGGPSTIGD